MSNIISVADTFRVVAATADTDAVTLTTRLARRSGQTLASLIYSDTTLDQLIYVNSKEDGRHGTDRARGQGTMGRRSF